MRTKVHHVLFMPVVPHSFAALVMSLSSGISMAVAADRPNIVFILADDLGYGSSAAISVCSARASCLFNRIQTIHRQRR